MAVDSHHAAPLLRKTREALLQGELLPFLRGLRAGAPAVMAGHLVLDMSDGASVALGAPSLPHHALPPQPPPAHPQPDNRPPLCPRRRCRVCCGASWGFRGWWCRTRWPWARCRCVRAFHRPWQTPDLALAWGLQAEKLPLPELLTRALMAGNGAQPPAAAQMNTAASSVAAASDVLLHTAVDCKGTDLAALTAEVLQRLRALPGGEERLREAATRVLALKLRHTAAPPPSLPPTLPPAGTLLARAHGLYRLD